MRLFFLALVSICLAEDPIAQLPLCSQDDYHYEYTECDDNDGRWRVYVPSNSEQCQVNPDLNRPPVRGKQCTFTCEAGQYLDIATDQECHECAAGTYSLGGGQRFTDFSTFPEGFSVKSTRHEREGNCTGHEVWSAAGEWMSVLAQRCLSRLEYRVTLVRKGAVAFEYSNADVGLTMFKVKVSSQNCEAANSGTLLDTTSNGEWKRRIVPLEKGLNVISWMVYNFELEESSYSTQKPVLLRKIEVEGVGYSSSCTPCPPGMFSKEGASECTPCPANTFTATTGTTTCQLCSTDTEYSFEGATRCEKKPPCKENDYFRYLTDCDQNDQTMVMYKWKKPQICLEDHPQSVKLPRMTQQKCPACNPAMQKVNNNCTACPEGQASNGSTACEKCKAGSAAHAGIFMQWWNTWPEHITPLCLSMSDKTSGVAGGCRTEQGWELRGDHVTSGTGHADNTFQFLSLELPGLMQNEDLTSSGELSVVIDMTCSADCKLLLLLDSKERANPELIDVIKGSQSKMLKSYKLLNKEAFQLHWIFERLPQSESLKQTAQSYTLSEDVVRIHTINVTNVLNAGADECRPCNATDGFSCKHCPAGTEHVEGATGCVPCLNNQISVLGVDNRRRCVACPPGLQPFDAKRCYSPCTTTGQDGKTVDLRPLNKLSTAEAVKVFSSEGSAYKHVYNISLCGNNGLPLAVCHDTTGSTALGDKDRASFVCNSIQLSDGKKFRYLQPSSMGTTISKVVSSRIGNAASSANDTIKLAFVNEQLGYDVKDGTMMTNFYYKDPLTSHKCTSGRSVVVTVFCDLNGDGNFTTPPKCPEGTCDGCNFFLLSRSPHGCPVCRMQDYTVIKGGCSVGKRKVYSSPPTDCYNVTGKPETLVSVESCPLLSREALIGISVAAVLAVILVVLLVKFYKRNRKLEYKYMKLVESQGSGGPGELPAAETCGLSDTSEDEDDDLRNVGFKRADGPQAFFNKVGRAVKKGSKKDDDGFEHMNLTDSMI